MQMCGARFFHCYLSIDEITRDGTEDDEWGPHAKKYIFNKCIVS